MGSSFFISDVHLGTQHSRAERLKEKRLISFLDHVAQYGDRLFIVGDLFDFWFEYRSVIPRGYTKILCALSQLNELGKELHYIAGNHDFWMRDFLQTEFNIQMHFNDFEYTLGNERLYIFHGDGLAKNDWGYRLLKRIFRNKINIFLYSLIHPDIGIPLAKWVSSLSREHTQGDNPPNDKDYLERAIQKFEEGYDYVIFGHLHYPKVQHYGQKIYINLGDWIDHFTYAEHDGESLNLLTWRG
ncbi:MAG: UDP-2,3-diacylglucosamine diphosphatase [Calditrichia bacterium]